MDLLIPLVIIAVVLPAQVFVQRSITSRFDYQCGNCGQSFSLTPGRAAIAPHRFGGSKYVKCPDCGSRSWASPVPK